MSESVVILSLASASPAYFAVSAPVARDAGGEIRYAFADMLGANIGFRMLMAAVAGVLPSVAGRMARGSGGIVIAIQHEESRVVESGWFPKILAVALGALCCRAAMYSRCGSGMTGRAILADRRIQQRVRDGRPTVRCESRAIVIGMARHAILGRQALMKWCHRSLSFDW